MVSYAVASAAAVAGVGAAPTHLQAACRVAGHARCIAKLLSTWSLQAGSGKAKSGPWEVGYVQKNVGAILV